MTNENLVGLVNTKKSFILKKCHNGRITLNFRLHWRRERKCPHLKNFYSRFWFGFFWSCIIIIIKNFFVHLLHYLGECSTLTLTSSSSVSTFKTDWREKCVGEEGGDRFNVDGKSVEWFSDENLFDSIDDVNLFDSFDNVNLFDNASVDGIWVDKTVGGDIENPLENVEAANDAGDELRSRDVKMELPFKVFSMFDDIWSTFVDIWSTFIDDNWSTFDETILQGRCMLCCWLAAAACATAACR